MKRIALALSILLLMATKAGAAPHRRALLIGIDDYSASRIAGWNKAAPPGRDYPNLRAAVSDAAAMRELLVLYYGFDPRDIVLMTNQDATREAILWTIDDRLVKPAAKDDVVFFYYAGHGSQVRNSLSDEPDGMDETLVPADSRAGASDLRDKELRPLFNRILDRGARLTVMLDNCFSGSGTRGLPTAAQPRGVRPDLRDVADRKPYGPRPEDRGALVLTAAQDDGSAYETNDRGQLHGTFTWAWLHAVRDAVPGESVTETFLRAQARTRAARPYQQPVLAGVRTTRLSPFLGDRMTPQPARIAVEKVQRDGSIVVQGGWANGLAIGSTLRLAADAKTRLVITAMLGLGRSEARLVAGLLPPAALQSGALLETSGWSQPAGPPLRVSVPRVNSTTSDLEQLARRMHRAATRRGIRWIRDPVDRTPSHLLRRGEAGWELVHDRTVTPAGDDDDAVAAIRTLPSKSALFVQLPAARTFAESIETAGTEGADADYVLAGRYSAGHLTYAWLRPAVTVDDRRRSTLPLRSAWTAAVPELRASLQRIRKVFGWQTLESPIDGAFAYRLALRRERDGTLARQGILYGGERYSLLLRAADLKTTTVARRFVYVFALDRDGCATLLFPSGGSVENHFPLQPDAPPPEIPLTRIRITEPYGTDTYFLLTSNDPLPDPWILSWDRIRAAAPSAWSLEKKSFESVPPNAESASHRTRYDFSCLPNRRSESRSRALLSSAAMTTSCVMRCAASRGRTTAASKRSSTGPAGTTSR